MEAQQDKFKIQLTDRIVSLDFSQFSDMVDLDAITKIDFSNIYNELATISIISNRFGFWRSEADEAVNKAKLDSEIMKAKKGEHYRKTLTKQIPTSGGGTKSKTPTKDEVDNSVTLDPEVQTKKNIYFRKMKEYGYVDSMYWSIKAKSAKLDRITESMSLTPQDFEQQLIEGYFNGVFVKKTKKLIN